MSEKILEIKDERLSFFTPAGEVKALNGVSFSMNQGDVLGIVGESGSGKSVTAYSIMGLTAYPGRLVGGTVWFNGHQIDKMTEKEFRKIRGNEVSIIFQDPMTSLNPVYTIGNQIVEVILLHTKKTKQEAWARARELLELVGINEPDRRLKQYPHELSGGMRQRVMIAIALACEPKLLIADEPTTALDVTIQAQILELMNDPSNMLELFTTNNGNNDGKYANPAFDKLIEESRVADKATHFEKLHEAEDMLMADAACIPVAYYNDFWLQSPSLKGTWHSPYGYWYLQYGYIEE